MPVIKAHFIGLPGAGRAEHVKAGVRVGAPYEILSIDGEYVTAKRKGKPEAVLPIASFPFLDPDYQFTYRFIRPNVKQASYLADRWGCSRESAQYLWPSAYPKRMRIMLRGATAPLKTDEILTLDGLPVADIIKATGWSEYTLKGMLGKPRYAARLWDIIRGLDA